MNMRKKLLLMRSSKPVNENKIFSGKSLSKWNMDNIAMAIMNENTRNSFCKLKLNYCWIYCKWKETTDEKIRYCWRDRQQTSYSGNIVRKIFVKLKHEKTAKRKLCQSQTWKWNYWWIDRQKQSLKIAVAHHDRNNVPTIIFCECQKKLLSNQLWMKIFAWKSFCQTETWNRN